MRDSEIVADYVAMVEDLKHDIADLETMVAHHKAASAGWRQAFESLKAKNTQLRELLNLEGEFADYLINYIDQSIVRSISDEISYHERRAALKGKE